MWGNREKIHGLEYPPGQRIIIKALNSGSSSSSTTGKPEPENIFTFDSRKKRHLDGKVLGLDDCDYDCLFCGLF